jgi:hypothetical protein
MFLKLGVIDKILVRRDHRLLTGTEEIHHKNDKVCKIEFKILVFAVFPGGFWRKRRCGFIVLGV